MSKQDVEHGLDMLAWSRADRLAILSGLDDAALDLAHDGERWTIREISGHIAGAEAWYLSQLDLPVSAARDDAESVRGELRRHLPTLGGVQKVVGKDGEFWSPRKLLRRALWHERDHTHHILKLLGALNESYP